MSSLQIAVVLLSRDVYFRRLTAFEKILDEESEIWIGVNDIFFQLSVYTEQQ